MVAPAASSSATSRVPASSRWMAKRRTRIRTGSSRAGVPGGDEQAVADRQDGADEVGVGQHLGTERAEGVGPVAWSGRPRARRPAAPEDVVSDDEGAGSEPRPKRLEIRRGFRLERVD